MDMLNGRDCLNKANEQIDTDETDHQQQTIYLLSYWRDAKINSFLCNQKSNRCWIWECDNK